MYSLFFGRTAYPTILGKIKGVVLLGTALFDGVGGGVEVPAAKSSDG